MERRTIDLVALGRRDAGRGKPRMNPREVVADAWCVRLSCRAIGETDPVHREEVATQAARVAALHCGATCVRRLRIRMAGTASRGETLDVSTRCEERLPDGGRHDRVDIRAGGSREFAAGGGKFEVPHGDDRRA